MTVHQIDPLQDPRWPELLQAHPQASIFHTPGWLESLRRTYGYEPLVLTTSPPGSALTNGVAFCRIKSWLTGERLVSVPFADHCQPLFERAEDFYSVLEWTSRGLGKNSRKYAEIRPLDGNALGLSEHSAFRAGKTFRLHLLDLKPSLDDLLRAFDKNSVQRRLRRAVKENLVYEEGNSTALLKKFYHLQVLTRRRHKVPPQPDHWFGNLLASLGEKVKIRVVSKDDTPVASILTLAYNGTVIYKYGCSDATYNNLAGTPFLFWQAIQEAKQDGNHSFDLGRSDLDNPGLITFKSHWGTADQPLTYWRFPGAARSREGEPSRAKEAGKYIVSHLPDSLLIFLGRTLYKHAG
jgi:CelD/BcsL family acetyltransferase involved in cellulose biosynthesis